MKYSAACSRLSRATPGDEIVVAIEDQEVIDRLDLARVLVPAERVHAEHGTAVRRVRGVEEVDDAGVVLRDVLEVCLGLADGAVDRRLVLRVERERLREASVLGGDDATARVERDEIVLHRLAVVLARERRRRLAGSRQAR